MKDIYEQAGQVCTWLGEMADASQLGIHDLQSRVAKEYRITRLLTATRITHELLSPSGLLVNGASSVAAQHKANLTHELDLGEIRELLSRPGWTCVWIMQEAIVARKLILMCGAETFEWKRLSGQWSGCATFGGP
jgi:Heterokaryon incompatibility protein (HET)